MSNGRKLDVLVVDDYAGDRASMRGLLEDEGHRVTEAPDAAQALEVLGTRRFDVVALDVNMPGMNGLVAMMRLRELDPDVSTVIVTGEDAIRTAREAVIKLGAYDVIGKPPDPEHLLSVLEEASRQTRMRRGAGGPAGDDLGILGESPSIQKLIENVRQFAPSQGRVLITGESGSGKELVAQAIHRLSKRASGPFVKLNCAAIPRELLESELFGHEKGAFTGAHQMRKGRFELADGGTLFLDEIGDLSLDAQAKVLRAIETSEVERVGGSRTMHVDVRLVSATHKDLQEASAAGEFREDLFYRLNVLPIHVPPLRERRGDVGRLAAHFLALSCAAEGRPAKRLSADAEQLLSEYHWPGNVRELRNLMERAAILVHGEMVEAGDLTVWLEPPPSGENAVGLRGELDRREAESIRRALEGASWNVTQAATSLGIDRTNLHRKMRKYGISRRG
jgi:two-component system, NtrC family, nitrogen regulation response regulator NtrX